MNRSALAAIVWLLPLAASADPLVVHTATARVDRSVSTAERLRLADAVADVIAAARPDVLRATETHDRVETLSPAGLACDAPECAASLLTPLHARGVVLVSVVRGRRRDVALTLRWLDAQGVVRGEQRAQEVIGGWEDAIAMGRVSARALLADLPAATPVPAAIPVSAPPVAPAPVPVPTAAPMTAPTASVRWVTARRPVEALLGGVLIAGGAAALTIGLVAVAQDGQPVAALENGREEVYTATARDAVLIGVGAAAFAGGVFLLIDGLRMRRSQVALTVRARPYADGAWVGLGGQL